MGSSADQVGQFCVQVVDRLLTRRLNLVSGSTVGSFCASSSLQFHFRGTVVLGQSSAADQAHLRSHSGPAAGEVLCGAPPSQFRTIVLERLRIPGGDRSQLLLWKSTGLLGSSHSGMPTVREAAS